MVMDVPRPLIADIKGGRCLPFVGAGFSLNANLPDDRAMPTWPELAAQLATMGGFDSCTDPMATAGEFERRFGRVSLIDCIRDSLHPFHARPGAAHLTFAELPFDTVYTTNFDLLLEDALAEVRRPFRSLVGELQMPFHGGVQTTTDGKLTATVVKMHGDIRHEEHIIVTKQDYDGYLTRYPLIATHLSAMLITRTPLFIGYSRTDQDFQQIDRVVRSRLNAFRRMPYLLTFDVAPADFEAMLGDQLHGISLTVPAGKSRGDVLAEFFADIQEQVDATAGKAFRASRPHVFEKVSDTVMEHTVDDPEASTLLSSSSSLCYVMLPPEPMAEQVYQTLIEPAAHRIGLEPLRAREIEEQGATITELIRVAIQQARICIAEVSERNSAVLYEAKLALDLGKPLVLLTRNVEKGLPEFQSTPMLTYVLDRLPDPELQRALEHTMQDTLIEGLMKIAERQIDSAAYRAGVASLGIVVEQTLRRLLVASLPSDPASPSMSIGRTSIEDLTIQLQAAGHLSDTELTSLQRFVEIRNKAVHQMEEPTQDEALAARAIVRDLLQNYPAVEPFPPEQPVEPNGAVPAGPREPTGVRRARRRAPST
jgi:hypothetical protein